MPLHILQQGIRVNADTYIDVLKSIMKPWIDKVAAGRQYVFQQDSAPVHKDKKTYYYRLLILTLIDMQVLVTSSAYV